MCCPVKGFKWRKKRYKLLWIDYPKPNNVHEVRVFLGFVGFYRKFIANFAKIARPLTDLKTKFEWNREAEMSYNKLKKLIQTAPMLLAPDETKPFWLNTDASDFAIGAVLSQKDDEDVLRPLAFYSSKLKGAEIRYPTHEKVLMMNLKLNVSQEKESVTVEKSTWKGSPQEENSWVPEYNLINAQEALDEFYNSQRQQLARAVVTDRVSESLQCKAPTKHGARCKRRTRKGDYCWTHMENNLNVRVKPSTIPQAGFGVFTAKKQDNSTSLIMNSLSKFYYQNNKFTD